MRKYIHYHPHVSVFRHLCKLHSLTPHIPFLLDGCYTGMTMLLIPLHVLSVIGLHPRTPVLGITKVSLECATKMWVDVTTDRCRACQKSIALSGKTKKRNFMDHVLRDVRITVWRLCYLTGCTEHVVHHCMRLHGQKNLHVPNAGKVCCSSWPARAFDCIYSRSQNDGWTRSFREKSLHGKEIFTTTQAQGDNGVGCSSAHIAFLWFFWCFLYYISH